MIIIGAGNLGQAIANYTNFERRGFVIRGMFDINPKLIGLVIRGIEIRSVDDLETFIRKIISRSQHLPFQRQRLRRLLTD